MSDQSGLALTEFAFAAPLLLMLGLGGLETANYALSSLRVAQIAMTVSDNSGRVRTAIDENDINDVMSGAKEIGRSINFTDNGRIILSDLEQRTNVGGAGAGGTKTPENPNGFRQYIRWQRCAGDLEVASSFGTPLDAAGKPVTNLDDKTNADHGAVETAAKLDGMGNPGNVISAATGTSVMFVEVAYTYQPITPFGFFRNAVIRMNQAFNVRERTLQPVSNLSGLTGNKRSDCRLFDPAVPNLG